MVFDILNSAAPFALLPILTRYLSPSEYGVIAMFAVLQQLFAAFVGLNTHGAVTVYFFRIDHTPFKLFVGNILFILLGSSTAVLLISVLFLNQLNAVTEVPRIWILLAAVSAATQFVTTINLTLWQAEENPRAFGLYQLLQTLVNVTVSLLLVVALGLGADGRLAGILVATVVLGTLSVWILLHRGYVVLRWNSEMVVRALRFGIPLLPHALAGIVKRGADRFLITALVGLQATGPYAAAQQVGSAIGLLALAFNKAYSPYLFRALKSIDDRRKQTIVRYTYVYFLLILLFAILLGTASTLWLSVLLGPNFDDAAPLVIWIAVAFAFDGMYYAVVNFIFYESRTEILTIVTTVGALFHIALCYLLINERGPIGAAQAHTVSAFLVFISVWFVSARVYKMPWLHPAAVRAFGRKRLS
jgi:O-antigen/teichoic acid export membrane protein